MQGLVAATVDVAKQRGVDGGRLSPSAIGGKREDKRNEEDDADTWTSHFSFSLTGGSHIFIFFYFLLTRKPCQRNQTSILAWDMF